VIEEKENEPHAKAQGRKGGEVSAPLRLCASFCCNAGFVLCFALLIRCGVLWLTPDALQNDPDDYLRLATNLVEHGTFGSGGAPAAYRPPLYPMVLTGCVLVGAHDSATVIVAMMMLHVLLGVATVGLVFLLGRWWGLGCCAAAVAALLVACDPILLRSSSLVMTETLATFLATAGLLALTWAEQRGTATGLGWQLNCHPNTKTTSAAIVGSQRLPENCRPPSRIPGAVDSRLFLPQIVAGIVLALAALCRPAFLLWTLAVAVVLCWRACRSIKGDSPIFAETKIGTVPNSRGPTARGRIASRLRAPAAFALGAIIVLSPWAIRNQIQFGRPIITTTHGGYTLLLANNPEFYDWLRHGSWGSVWRADRFNADWDRRRPSDELQADRLAYAEAWQTIRTQPGTFLYACAVRIGRFWSPLPHRLTADETPLHRLSRYAVALWYLPEFALALLGIWSARRGKGREKKEEGKRERGQILTSPAPNPPPPHPPSAWLWGVLLVGCLLAGHVVYWTDMRMRAPIMPVVAIFAAAGLPCCRPRDNLMPRKVDSLSKSSGDNAS
jgi:hypothetical protein